MVNLGLRARIGGTKDEKEKEQNEAGADEIIIFGGDFISKFFNCLGVARLASSHADFCGPVGLGSRY